MFIFYDESILSYVSSIRDYFGLSSSYKPNRKFQELLKKEKPNKVFLILIDGMGANTIEKHLDKESFLRRNMMYKVQTVFPTTTTAALTAIQNGKAPNENAWLAWNEYIKEIDDYIIPFQNKGFYTEKKYENGFMQKYIPIRTTVEDLLSKGIDASNILPNFDDESRHTIIIPYFKKKSSLDEFCDRILDNDANSPDKYIFCYYDTLDHVMHDEGPSSEKSIELLKRINDSLENVSRKISKDTMLVIVADHGQIEVGDTIVLSGTKYDEYMERKVSLDPRAVGFYIKDKYKEVFEKEFVSDFENDFILLNKQQVLDTKLFGYNENHPKFIDLIPDYVAVGKTNKIMFSIAQKNNYKGHHTGINDDEVYVPVIVFKK